MQESIGDDVVAWGIVPPPPPPPQHPTSWDLGRRQYLSGGNSGLVKKKSIMKVAAPQLELNGSLYR